MTTEISTHVKSAISEYNPIAAVLADLTQRHKGVVFDVTQPSGMREAKAAAKDIAQYRIALEKTRVELKADVLKRGRLLDSEAKVIADKLAELEDPIVDQIKAEERRIEAERLAAIVAEQERLAAIERARKEAEEKHLAEQRADIARQQAALREQTDKAMREREEADRQARAKIEAEERASRERIAAAEAKARAERQAEEDRLRAERERLDAERRAADEVKRKELEARESAERERRRQENELVDARAMLDTFVQRFGHRKEFATVVTAIKALLRKKAA